MVKCLVEAAPTKHANAVLDCYSKDGARVEIAAARRTPPHPGVPYVLINGKEFNAIDDTAALRKAICDAMPHNAITGEAVKSCQQGFVERYGSYADNISVDGVKKAVSSGMKYVSKKFESIFKL
jgi:hypothetical protein